jgi:hypothetical protein
MIAIISDNLCQNISWVGDDRKRRSRRRPVSIHEWDMLDHKGELGG